MKKNAKTYPPLDFVQKLARMNPEDFGYGCIQTYNADVLAGIDEKEFTHFLCGRQFLMADASPRYRKLNSFLLQLAPALIRADAQARIPGKKAEPGAELKDVLLAPELWMRWGRNKQVFRPDAEFIRALIKTESLQLSRNQLEHLPVNDFYVDLTEAEDDFKPVIGGLVSVESFAESVAITVYLLTKELAYFSLYSGGTYDERGILSRDLTDDIRNSGENEYDIYTPHGVTHYGIPAVSRKRASLLCMQILCYLTSRRPDITESPLTRSTYRPVTDGVVRQRFSEVEIHDVGTYYGRTIRALKKVEMTKSEKEEDKNQKEDKNRTARKPPRPHFRCAHWQRYWTGKGRTNCEVIWCAPSFVGQAPERMDVEIHKMKE